MKFLWLLWSGYILYLLYSVYTYFKGKDLVSNMEIYNTFFIKKIAPALVVLMVSFALNYIGKPSLAKWVAGIPAVIACTIMLFALLAWLSTWFVMWWGSK